MTLSTYHPTDLTPSGERITPPALPFFAGFGRRFLFSMPSVLKAGGVQRQTPRNKNKNRTHAVLEVVLMQTEMRLFGDVNHQTYIPIERIRMCRDFVEACLLSVRCSGKPDHVIAEAVGMDKGNFARFLQGQATKVFKYINTFMQATGNLAPLQWLADANGYILVKRQD